MAPRWSLLMTLAVAACDTATPTPQQPRSPAAEICAIDSDCGEGARCVAGICSPGTSFDPATSDDASIGIDAGLRDGATNPRADAAALDTGSTTTSPVDAGGPLADSGSVLDVGGATSDTGVASNTVPDSGVTAADSGVTAADSGVTAADSGTSDAGVVATSTELELGGYVLENAEHLPARQRFEIPSGTLLRANEVLIIVRGATRADFESALGMTLGSDVRFINAESGNADAPIINGGEQWQLVDPSGAIIDGPTMPGDRNRAYVRVGADASDPSSWADTVDTAATPGPRPAVTSGPYIGGWSDASGSGRYVFEFVEIHYGP